MSFLHLYKIFLLRKMAFIFLMAYNASTFKNSMNLVGAVRLRMKCLFWVSVLFLVSSLVILSV